MHENFDGFVVTSPSVDALEKTKARIRNKYYADFELFMDRRILDDNAERVERASARIPHNLMRLYKIQESSDSLNSSNENDCVDTGRSDFGPRELLLLLYENHDWHSDEVKESFLL